MKKLKEIRDELYRKLPLADEGKEFKSEHLALINKALNDVLDIIRYNNIVSMNNDQKNRRNTTRRTAH